MIGHIGGCVLSQFLSNASCNAVSIPIIIGAAFPYKQCISSILCKPTCFFGGKVSESSESSVPVIFKIIFQN